MAHQHACLGHSDTPYRDGKNVCKNANRKQTGMPHATYFVFLWCDSGGEGLVTYEAKVEAGAENSDEAGGHVQN